MRADHVVIAVATPIGTGLLYFLLAGEVSAREAIAGAPVVLIASLYALALARSGTVDLQLVSRGLRSLLLGVLAVVPESWRVGRALVLAVRRRPADMMGVVVHVPFRFGGLESADIGRRAAVVTGLSLAPNGFALGMDHKRDELIVHQLVPTPIGRNPEWPL